MKELKHFGLSDKEIKVYLTTLKLGGAPVVRILKSTGIARSTIYDILNTLITKGLIKSYKKDKKLYFDAIRPRVILEQQKEKEKIFRNILPQLEKLAGTIVEKPSVEIFEGKKGVLALLEEVYGARELWVYGSAKKSAEVLKHLPENFARKRAEKKVMMKAILERSKQAFFRIEDSSVKEYTKIRFLDKMGNLPSVTFIYGKQVAILTLEKELVGVKISDLSINKTQRVLFEILWELAK